MDTSFCIEALEEALKHYGPPDIFNSDQGSQFTSTEFTQTLIEHNVRISMDGKGRWVDNVFIERLWRSLKYEEVYLKAYTTPRKAELEIGNYTWCFIMKSVTIKDSITSLLMRPTSVGKDTQHELGQPLKKLAYVSNHRGPLLPL
jgi:transposase InsO family protein